jgi:phasin family protein
MTKSNSNNKSAADFFSQSDFTKFFAPMTSPAFGVKSLMESQRKNMQALTEAQQLAFQGIRAIAQRQSELLSRVARDNSVMAREMMAEGTPEEKMSRNADAIKSVYERAIEDLRALSDMANKSSEEATGVITKRIAATMNEIQTVLEKSQKNKAE